MRSKLKVAYNPFFLFPFLIWVLVGAVLLSYSDKVTLFTFFNSHYSAIGDIILYPVTWMGQAEVIIPVLLLLTLIRRFRNWWYIITALLCNILPLLLQQYLKSWFDRPRPLNYFNHASWIHILPEWPVYLHRSFPSGHSEGAFSFFCFLSLLLTEKNSKVGLLFFLMALSVCYSRMYLAAHFFEDVYAGSIIGMMMTTFIFSVMNKYKASFFRKKIATS